MNNNSRWKIEKATNLHTPHKWIVHSPDGSWAGAYATWGEAMLSVTTQINDAAAELEHWLKKVLDT